MKLLLILLIVIGLFNMIKLGVQIRTGDYAEHINKWSILLALWSAVVLFTETSL